MQIYLEMCEKGARYIRRLQSNTLAKFKWTDGQRKNKLSSDICSKFHVNYVDLLNSVPFQL